MGFSQLRICRPSPSVLIRFSWMMGSVLYSMGKIMKKFSDFYFSSYGWKLVENFGNFKCKNDHNSKNKNHKFGFTFYSADSRSFEKKKLKFWKMLKDFQFFFLAEGFAPPHPHRGCTPWIPHAFGLRTLVGTGTRSMAFKELPVSLFFLHNSKNNNRKNLKFGFSFYSADSRSFMWIWPLLIFF